MAETIAQLNLPDSPADGLDAQRIADLIVMGDALEQQEGVSHVAFNFMATEVSKALESGLEAGQRRDLSALGPGALPNLRKPGCSEAWARGTCLRQGWHSWRDDDTGRSRRRRTFYLDRSHPLVQKVLQSHWNSAASPETLAATPEEPPQAEPFPGEPLNEEPIEEGPLPGNEAGKPEPSFISRLFRLPAVRRNAGTKTAAPVAPGPQWCKSGGLLHSGQECLFDQLLPHCHRHITAPFPLADYRIAPIYQIAG